VEADQDLYITKRK